MEKLTKLSYIILFIFALFGASTASMVIHELSHKQDFEEYSIDGRMALFVIPDNQSVLDLNIAAYHFYYDPENTEEINKIKRHTEFKAYSIGYLPMIVLAIAMFIIAESYYQKKRVDTNG